MNPGRLSSLVALIVAGAGVPSCFTDNPATYQGILGPTREPPAGSSGGAAGRAGGAGGPTAGGGQTSAGGGGASGGDSAASPGGEAGEATTGGSSGRGGGAGTGSSVGGQGASAGNPPIDPDFSPPCFLGPTVSGGEEIKKGTSCTAEDPPLCYRTCGPNQTGWKTETCLAGVYAEGDCTFPPENDYSCYKIPDPIDTTACGLTAPPAATDPCTAPLCMSCNFDGFYEDTGSDVKLGFCTCREADGDGVRRWTCASETAWPCPLNQGC